MTVSQASDRLAATRTVGWYAGTAMGPAGVTGPRFTVLLLATLAALTLAFVRWESASLPASLLVRIACELAFGLGLWLLTSHRAALRARGTPYFGASLLVALVFPLLVELLLRGLDRGGEPPELLMLSSLELVAFVMAAFSFLPKMGGTSVLLSSFLLLFATTMASGGLVHALAGVYGATVLWWLMAAYWGRIEGALIASTVERRIPLQSSILALTAALILLVGAVLSGRGNVAVALHGFMPTSGGDRWHDPHARAGVGDGDAMVAAKDQALSFGPVESELFLDSEMPSLYDMVDEMYGEPPRPKKKSEMTIALGAQNRTATEQKMAQSQRSGREFSAVRRPVSRGAGELADRSAAAMFYVVGQTPVHLALETFDSFDGRQWTQGAGWDEPHAPSLDTQGDRPWIRLRSGSAAIFRGEVSRAIKVINLKTNRLPAPPHLTAIHLDRVDRADFFAWTKDGMIEMTGRDHVPQLTVVHLRSPGLNLSPLRRGGAARRPRALAVELEPYRQLPAASWQPLAAAWTAGVPSGWLQVEAIVDRLHSDFEFDPMAGVPDDAPDAVAHFLQVRRGPDYLFATTAVMLLRSLGHPARLATGFYARSDRFDHRARQTTVLGEDVHVWAEVCVDGRNWVTIEPTPGYAPPHEVRSWTEWATEQCRKLARWSAGHGAELLTCAVGIGLLVVLRRVCLDAVGAAICWLCGCRGARARLVWTIRMLEWRAWLTNRKRPPERTVAMWYGPLRQAATPETLPLLESFFRWSDRLLYSPHAIPLSHQSEIQQSCRAVAAVAKRSRLQSCLSSPTSDRT